MTFEHKAAAPAAAPPSCGIAPPGYRLPASTRLGRVALQVADLDRSLAYYQQVIGLKVLRRAPDSALLGAGGDAAALLELRERPGARPVPRRGRLGLFHFAILIPDRGALGCFVAHLASLNIHPGMSDHLVSEAIYLSDPDGLGIEVYADRPRDSWRYHDGQIAMATEPLDLENVLRESGGASWSGMPPGTTIGHVHLHVADLEVAARFYHAALGFDKVVWSYPGALFLSAGGYHHHLGTNSWAAGAAPAGEEDARLLDWVVQLPDAEQVELAARSLASGGYTVAVDGSSRVAADPWGTRVRLAATR